MSKPTYTNVTLFKTKYAAADGKSHGYVLDWREALRTEWPCDAHFATYVAYHYLGETPKRAPRIAQDSSLDGKLKLRHIREAGNIVLHHVRVADCDTWKHGDDAPPITQEQIEEMGRRLAGQNLCWYPTLGGVRIVQPLARCLSPEEYRAMIGPWLVELRKLTDNYLKIDDLRDWTRLMRLPRVVREPRKKGGDPKNLWDTPIYGIECTPVDVGDIKPDRGFVQVLGEFKVSTETTERGAKEMRRIADQLAGTPPIGGTTATFAAACQMANWSAAGELLESDAMAAIEEAIRRRGFDPAKYKRAIQNGWACGLQSPAQLPGEYREMPEGSIVTDYWEDKMLTQLYADLYLSEAELAWINLNV